MDFVHYEQMICKQFVEKNTCKKVDLSCDNKTMGAKTHSLKSMGNLF